MAKERVERDEEDLVRLYLTDIGQYPLLTKDDEVRLAQAIEAGNEARTELDDGGKEVTPGRKRELRRTARAGETAERTFVQSNLRLVVSIAKKYQASGLPLLDLIQEGNLGLMHAVEKFDWRKGFKFSTYATWWIRQAITRGIANTGRTIRLPVHAGDTLARLQKARARLELKLGRPATLAELSAEVEMPEDKVTEALRFAAEPLSLSEPLREDGDAELGDVVEDRSAESPFEVAATALLPDEINRLLAPLDDREREILKLRFGLDRGEPRTLEEVGEHFNLTRERIRQIEARAMSKLRHPSSDTGARDLLAVLARLRPPGATSRGSAWRLRRVALPCRHEEAAHPHRLRCAGLDRGQEGSGAVTAPLRRHHHHTPTARATAAAALPPIAACFGAGMGTRSRSGTSRRNCSTCHPRSRAARNSSRSGFTATGCPTAASIGMSVAESEYAQQWSRSRPSRSATSVIAATFSSA